MHTEIQLIRNYLKTAARSFGLGDLQIDIVEDRRSFTVYATQPNPAAKYFIETYPVLRDDNPRAFTPHKVARWKLVNAKFSIATKIDGDAFFYLLRHASEGNIHPMLDNVVSIIYQHFMNHLDNIRTELVKDDVSAASPVLPGFDSGRTKSTTPHENIIAKLLKWLSWLTTPRVYDIPYKSKGIYPSTGEWVEDTEQREALERFQSVAADYGRATKEKPLHE